MRRFPAMGMAGGEGKVGENGEGLESYPWVVVGGAEVVGAGLSTARGGRWRDWAVAALLRRCWEGGGVAGLGNVGLGRPVRDELSSLAPMAAVDGVWAPEGA